MTEVLPGPQPALRPLAQDLAQSTSIQIRLGLLAWAGAVTPVLWKPGGQGGGGGGGGPGPDTVIP